MSTNEQYLTFYYLCTFEPLMEQTYGKTHLFTFFQKLDENINTAVMSVC